MGELRGSVVLVTSKGTTEYAFGAIREQFVGGFGTVQYHGQPVTRLTFGIYGMDSRRSRRTIAKIAAEFSELKVAGAAG